MITDEKQATLDQAPHDPAQHDPGLVGSDSAAPYEHTWNAAFTSGHATSTLKHPSLTGLRLAIVQPIGSDDKPEADPQVVVDRLGAGPGQRVVVNSDGRAARELVGSEKTPVRFFVIAIVNDKE